VTLFSKRFFKKINIGITRILSFGESKWADLLKKGPKIIILLSSITIIFQSVDVFNSIGQDPMVGN
jgi:hypothetical protein